MRFPVCFVCEQKNVDLHDGLANIALYQLFLYLMHSLMKVSRGATSTRTGHEAQYYTKQQKNAEYSHRLIGLPDLTPPSFKEEQKYIIVAKVMYVQREVTI